MRDGKWVDGKLSFTLDFKKHESIAITGAVKEGKLAGQFTTEGFTEKWEARQEISVSAGSAVIPAFHSRRLVLFAVFRILDGFGFGRVGCSGLTD